MAVSGVHVCMCTVHACTLVIQVYPGAKVYRVYICVGESVDIP